MSTPRVRWSEGKPVEAVKPSVFLHPRVYERAKKKARREEMSFSQYAENLIVQDLAPARR